MERGGGTNIHTPYPMNRKTNWLHQFILSPSTFGMACDHTRITTSYNATNANYSSNQSPKGWTQTQEAKQSMDSLEELDSWVSSNFQGWGQRAGCRWGFWCQTGILPHMTITARYTITRINSDHWVWLQCSKQQPFWQWEWKRHKSEIQPMFHHQPWKHMKKSPSTANLSW